MPLQQQVLQLQVAVCNAPARRGLTRASRHKVHGSICFVPLVSMQSVPPAAPPHPNRQRNSSCRRLTWSAGTARPAGAAGKRRGLAPRSRAHTPPPRPAARRLQVQVRGQDGCDGWVEAAVGHQHHVKASQRNAAAWGSWRWAAALVHATYAQLTGQQVHDQAELAVMHKPFVQLDEAGVLQLLQHGHLPPGTRGGLGQGRLAAQRSTD